MKLSNIEKDIIKEIINIGLARAGDSLSFFTGERVIIDSINYKVEKVSEIKTISSKEGKNLTLLWTEIQGDASGWCFLIFNENEVEKLSQISLPKEVYEDPKKQREMTLAVLLEVDNIITASVVTQFANILGIKMLGHIPNFEASGEEGIKERIRSKVHNDNYIIKFKASYLTDKHKMAPEFVWVLEKEFLNRIIAFSKSDENIKLIEKLNNLL